MFFGWLLRWRKVPPLPVTIGVDLARGESRTAVWAREPGGSFRPATREEIDRLLNVDPGRLQKGGFAPWDQSGEHIGDQ